MGSVPSLVGGSEFGRTEDWLTGLAGEERLEGLVRRGSGTLEVDLGTDQRRARVP